MKGIEFNLSEYNASRKRIARRIRERLVSGCGAIFDGIIAPAVYAQEPIRILCLSEEAYIFGHSGLADIEDPEVQWPLAFESFRGEIQRRLLVFTYLLLRTLKKRSGFSREERSRMPYPDLSDAPENHRFLQDSFERLAWVHVKKMLPRDSDPSTAPAHIDQLVEIAALNGEILADQIFGAAPHLIVAFGHAARIALLEAGKISVDEFHYKKPWEATLRDKRAAVLFATHPTPSHPDWHGPDDLFNNVNAAFEQLSPLLPHRG